MTAAAVLSIAYGGVIALLGVLLVVQMFMGRSLPVGGAGPFIVLTLGLGPIVALAGTAIVFSALELIAGHAWAITALDVAASLLTAGSLGWLVHRGIRERHIHRRHIIRGALFFAATGGVGIAVVVLLHVG